MSIAILVMSLIAAGLAVAVLVALRGYQPHGPPGPRPACPPRPGRLPHIEVDAPMPRVKPARKAGERPVGLTGDEAGALLRLVDSALEGHRVGAVVRRCRRSLESVSGKLGTMSLGCPSSGSSRKD